MKIELLHNEIDCAFHAYTLSRKRRYIDLRQAFFAALQNEGAGIKCSASRSDVITILALCISDVLLHLLHEH